MSATSNPANWSVIVHRNGNGELYGEAEYLPTGKTYAWDHIDPEDTLSAAIAAVPIFGPGAVETLRAAVLLRIRRLEAGEAQEEPADFAASQHGWPALAPAALHGLAGEFVALVEPSSEADPAALLGQFLVAFGSAANRGAYFSVEATRHYLNLFLLLVGATSKSRKGTSAGRVESFYEMVDDTWARSCVVQGLASGEGLIWRVRDATTKRVRVKPRGGGSAQWEEQVEDRGVTDKRLLVVEEEFGKVLKAMSREGSTLSAIIREAWDGRRPLSNLVTRSTVRATDAHISIVGHITEADLHAGLRAVESANGFANRFLYVLARRSKAMPEGGAPEPFEMQDLARRTSRALDHARTAGEVRRDAAAGARWCEKYISLSEGYPGLLGAVLGRAEAQVMRLAALYAMLDCSRTIGLPHLDAALAFWDYCEASAKRVFGDALGSPAAEQLWTALRARQRLTFTEVMVEVFQNHKTRDDVNAAVKLLEKAGLAQVISEETGGRPRRVLTLSTLSTHPPLSTHLCPSKLSTERVNNSKKEREAETLPERDPRVESGESVVTKPPSDAPPAGDAWEPPQPGLSTQPPVLSTQPPATARPDEDDDDVLPF